MTQKLLTVEQIAEYLQVKPSTVYQRTHQGYIPHVKIGNLVRFRLSAIDRWMEKRTVEGRKNTRVDMMIK